jgi:hypothetical protein
MLHAVSGKNLCRTIVAMDRQRHNHGALRILEPVPVSEGHLQAIRHQIELLARHAKRGVIVDIHESNICRSRLAPKAEIDHPARLSETTLLHLQANFGACPECDAALTLITFEKFVVGAKCN